MKRLLSFVLSFAMVFTMFAPSAYAMETAVDYSDVPSAQSGGYVLYNNGTDGEQTVNYTQSSVIYAQQSAYVWVTDGYENYPVTDYYYTNDFDDGLTTTIESDGRVQIVGDYSVIGQLYELNMVTEMGTYSIPLVVNELLEVDRSNDGVWLSKDGVKYQRFEGEPFELGLDETLYFYVVSQGVQVYPDSVYHYVPGIAEFNMPVRDTGETVGTMWYKTTPSEGTVYGYAIEADGTPWEYCVTLPTGSSGTADINNLTVYLEYGDKTVNAADTLNGKDYLSVPKGETFAIYAVDSNGNYITSESQILGLSAYNFEGLDIGYTSADNDTKLYATVGIPNNSDVGLGSQGFSIGFTDGVVPDGQAPWYEFNIEIGAPIETTTAVYYNVNSTGWQEYAESSTVSFAVYDIVQVYVKYNGEHIPVNTTQFTYDGMNYGSYNGYLDHDANGMYQTLYFTPETAEEWLDCQLYMESLSAPGEEFTFDFNVYDQGKQLTTVENFHFEYSDGGVYYDYYNLGEEITMAPGGRMYLRLVGPDGYIYGEEAALFNTIDDFDNINITYTAGDKWCIDAGSSFTGKDIIYVIHNGIVYGEVVINVAAVETETGYSDISIIKDGTTSYYDSTPVQVEQDGYFDIAFLDASGLRIASDYVTVSEEGKTVLEKYGISLAKKSDRIRITPSTETPEGTYTAYFTVRDQYAEVKFTVKGGESYVGEAVLKWGTSMSSLTEYNWKANTLETVQVNKADTLYIEFTDAEGTRYPTYNYTVTGINGSDPNGIFYYVSDGNVSILRFEEVEGTGEYFIDFTNDLGEFTFYFELVDDSTGEEPEFDYNNKFTGKVEYRYEGDTKWTALSDGSYTVSSVVMDFRIYNNIELRFTDTDGTNVSESVWFPGEYSRALTWAWNEEYLTVFADSSELLNHTVSVDMAVNNKYYRLNFIPQYDEPATENLAEFKGYAEGVIGPHDDLTYVDLDEYYHPATTDCVLGVRFIDENGDVIPMQRVKPVVSSLDSKFDVHWGFNAWRDATTDKDFLYNEWEIWPNTDDCGGSYEAQFVIDDEYLATITFHVQASGNMTEAKWDWDFAHGTFQVPTTGKRTLDVIVQNYDENYEVSVQLGYVNGGVFTPYDNQNDGSMEITWSNNKPYQVTFDGSAIANNHYECVEQGYFHVALVVTNKTTGERISVNGCDVQLVDTYGEYQFAKWDWGSNNDIYLQPNGYRTAGIMYKGVTPEDSFFAEVEIGYYDEYGNYVNFDPLKGYSVREDANGVPYEVEFDFNTIVESYVEAYEAGGFVACISIRDRETNNLIDRQLADVIFGNGGGSGGDDGSDEDYENMEGVPAEKFYGTVNWRVSGQTEWQTASVSDFVTPEGAIVLDLYEVLELQFIDEDGNIVGNISNPRGRQEGQICYALFNQEEGAHFALSNSSTAMMREGGSIVTHFSVGGRHYVLRYLLQEPYIGEPTADFEGYAMAVTEENGSTIYENFENFYPTAEWYNRFGIQFFDSQGKPVDASRVQLLSNPYRGIDLTLVTDRDEENAQWVYSNWEVVFNDYAEGGVYFIEFLIDGEYHAAAKFEALDGSGSGGGDEDMELYAEWNGYYDEDTFVISTKNKTSIGLNVRYPAEGFVGKWEFGTFNEDTFTFTPYEQAVTGVKVIYDSEGMPHVVEFDGAAIAKAYPEDYANGYIHGAFVIYNSEGEIMDFCNADFFFTDEAVNQFEYEYDAEGGWLEIWSAPATINADIMKETFGDIAKNVNVIIIRGANDYYRSTLAHIEGSEVLKVFTNVTDMNLFGVEIIDSGAFKNMSKLDYVHISGIGTMGDGVFENCTALRDVRFFDVKNVGVNTFKNCPQLTSAGTDGYGWFNIEIENYWDDDREGIFLPENLFVGSSVNSVYIDGYTHIGQNAFGGLNLNELYIGERVRVIDNAFNGATIDTLYTADDRDFFFEDTQIIGNFSYNRHIPNYVYVITEGYAGTYRGDYDWDDNIIWTLYSDGQMIFRGEGAMGDPQIWEDTWWEWDEETQTEVEVPYYFNESEWVYWPAARKIVIEKGITSISDMAFYNMHNIEEVVIADSVTSIGSNAFGDCGFITSVVIPGSVTDIADHAFGENTEVQSVWYPDTQAQWNDFIGGTSQPAFAYSDIHTQAVATYELDDRFREARIGLRKADSNSDGYYYYIQVPAGTQLEFVVPANATLSDVTVNSEHVFNNTFIATSGDAWVDANIGVSNIIAEGEFGSNISWVIDGDTLIIYGSGAMKNLDSVADAPWFEYLDVIEYIAIEEGVTAVGNNNFTELYNVKGISLPSTVTKTDTNNFLGMPELVYIEVAPGNTAFSAVNGMLMDKAGTTLIKVPAMLEVADGILELPDTVKDIKESAFEINYNIRELVVPDGVTTIGTYAFACMYNLESITIGNGVKEIPAYAFAYSDSLRKIIFGENVSTIGAGAFSCLYNIEDIIFQGETPKFVFADGMVFSADGKVLYAVTDSAIIEYADSDFGYVVVPYGVETVAERAFYCLDRLEAVQLPASVKTIGKYAFQYCENLVRIIVPASVTKIDTGAFSGSGITNGRGHWDYEEGEDGILQQIWVVDVPGTVYYGGTQAQWNKIKANIQSDFDENQDVIFGFDVAGKLNVLSSEFTAEERTKIVKYDALITEEIELSIGVTENPITGETAEYVQPMLTWDMEGYGENFNVMPSDEEGVYVVTIAAGGTYTFMAYNGDNPKDSVTFTYKVAEKATQVSFNQLKGGHTREGAYVIAAGKSVTPALKWTGGDNKAWTKNTFTAVYDIVCDDEYRQYVTVDPVTGKVAVEKDAPKFNFTLTYTATENNSTMGEGYTVYAEYPMLAVTKLVDKVLVTNENEGFTNLPIGSKVVIDQASGVTEFTFRANASNDGWAYNEFEFTAPVSQNFTVVDNGDNTATVTLIGGTGSVVVTAKALDGSNKTAKVTFTTGTAVKELNIATTMETTPVDLGDGDILNVIALAKGKSATLTADILPSTATNKAVTWEILGNPAVATVANGKVTAKAPGMVVVRAVAQDGSGAVAVMGVQVFEAATKVQINGLEGITDGRVLIGEANASFAVEAIPMRNVFDENGKAIKNQFTEEDVFSDVTWSISGGIAKDVRYEVIDAQYDADGNLITPASAVFTVNKAGTFSVKATANDGSGKSATYKVTVVQVPYAMSLTAPKGAGKYMTVNGETWIVKGDTAKGITVKPTVVFNGGSKVKAVKAPYNAYKLYLDGEEVSGTSVKVYQTGKYLLTAEDYSGNVTAEVILDIREKSAIDLESLEIKLPNTIGEAYYDVQYAVKGKEFEISRYLNGILAGKIDTNKIDVVWNVTNSLGDPANDVIVTKSNGKSYLKFNASHTGGHTISLTLVDKADPANSVISNEINVVAVDALDNGALWFGIYEEYYEGGFANRIEEMDKTFLNPLAGTTSMTVNNSNWYSYKYCQNFEVKSSNAKVLEIVKTDRDVFDVTPKAAGTVTLTIKALDGSGKTFTVKGVKVYPVDSPVNKITASGTSYSVNPEQPIVVEYGLVSKTGKPDVVTEVSCTDMEWTSSDERIATVTDITAEHETTSVTDSKGNVTYTSKGQLAIKPTDKTGKVTITGKALDGSGKTVKITVTVAKDSATQQLSLNVPANAANGGQTDGTVVLGWGKNLKLTATLKPNKAKNKAVTYKIEAVDAKDSDNVIMTAEELAALGVSVNKSGTVAAKAASKALPNPYTGWVKVTATLNYQMLYMDGDTVTAEDIEAVQYIYIERPMAKMRLTAVNASNKVVAVTGETIKKDVIAENSIEIDLTGTYTHEVTYKGYSAKVDGVMTDLTTAEPLYSAADNLLWTTNNPALATVDQNGVVTVNQYTKAGNVTITAMAQDGSNVKMTYKITIKAK